VAETNLKEINLMLDMIRSNLANIARTWGRDSPQYRSAKEIMQAYLAENVARLRERKGTRTTSIDDEMDTTHPPDSASKTRQIERSIEELMDGLELD
jgi:flagellar basal body rod protein FlgC